MPELPDLAPSMLHLMIAGLPARVSSMRARRIPRCGGCL
jgi:hypothetical protein